MNPTFGKGSEVVGGADADLVIDETIIDIKTTVNLKLARSDLNQVLGYYVLHEIGGVGETSPKARITKVGIYFSRYAYLHILELDDLIKPDSFPRFVRWFKDRAEKEYGGD